MVSEKQNNFEATLICWAVAAFAGFISMILLYGFADFGALQAVFTGGLIGTVLGVILTIFLCRDQTSAADLASEEKPAQRYARQAAEDMARRRGSSAPAAAASATAADTAAPASAAPTSAAVSSSPPAGASAQPVTTPSGSAAVKPSQPLAGEAELAARKGSWKYEKDAGKDPKKGAIAAGETAAPAVAPTKEASEAAAKPVAADGKPELYTAPPPEGADDLKMISGVGPKLEQTLNELGIYRFEQVAGWRKQEIDWVDQRLRFKGRIERDDWMAQAKILAAGGETEFSSKKKK